jgi:hypothetical protein
MSTQLPPTDADGEGCVQQEREYRFVCIDISHTLVYITTHNYNYNSLTATPLIIDRATTRRTKNLTMTDCYDPNPKSDIHDRSFGFYLSTTI